MMDRTKWNQRTPTSWIAVTALLVFACFWVACGGGAGSVNNAGWNAITPPKLTGISPATGPTTGGTTVAITGTDIQMGATVLFGNVPAAQINSVTSTSIEAVTPVHDPGNVDVKITNPDTRSDTLLAAFAFEGSPPPIGGPPPTVNSVLPNSGPVVGGTVVTITGTHFQSGATVTFGQSPAAAVVFSSATQLQATTPAHAQGTVDVIVRNPDTQSAMVSGGFTYQPVPAPTIVSLLPTSGPEAGGTLVTVWGTNFLAGATVSFGGVAAASVTVTSATQLGVVTPPHAAGVVDVRVTNLDGQFATLVGAFTYGTPPPTITGVSPGSGTTDGGATATVTGTGFQAGATVTFGGLTAAVINLTSTSIAVTTPAHAAGPVGVTVTNPGLQSVTLPAGYTYITPGPAPTISTTLLPEGNFLVPYSTNLAGSGGTPPYSWSVVPGSGNLPPGVTLDAATGALSGTPVQIGTSSYTIQLMDAASQTATQALSIDVTRPGFDQYGGLTALPSPNPATGFFRIEKIGSRWVLIDPDNNAFIFFGVAVVSNAAPGRDPASSITYADYVQAKYNNSTETWATQTKLRLLTWGFNGIGMFEASHVKSYGSFGRQPNPPLMPHFNLHVQFGANSIKNTQGLIANSVKNILYKTPDGGVFPDVFDPGFTTYANTAMNTNMLSTTGGIATEINSPWVIGIITDESDTLNGFGMASLHKHLGWAVLASNPSMSSFVYLGVTYNTTDLVNYTKTALRDFLKTRYGNNIATLNTAWGSSYTTFDSAGGWVASPGVPGTGLMDENGTHAWVGNRRTLAGSTAAFQTDMNDFMSILAEKYCKTCHDAIRSVDTNHLIFGPVVVTTDTRPQILNVAKNYVDAFFAHMNHASDTGPAPSPVADIYNTAGKPVIAASHFFTAEADSPFSGFPPHPNTSGFTAVATQAERGAVYANWINDLMNLQGTDGSKFVIGYHWWALVDNSNEQHEFGVVTYRDNVYDGVEAKSATGTDPWGYAIGGEVGDYGDLITAMRSAHLAAYQKVASGN